MKTMTALTMGLTLAVSVLAAIAQDNSNQNTAPAWPCGPMWNLTPEQQAARQQQVQATLADLRAKRDNGTIAAHEKAWLDWMEQAGGMCVNGVPRGGRWGMGNGPRNGTGPRAQMGLCPFATNAPAAAVTPGPGGRGPGFGMGYGGGRGRGQGGGFGPRNGTGPRAQMGTCPLVNPPAK
jgi:hypothetical protein